jgi:hypothetical protein
MTVIDVKNFPFFGSITESCGEKQGKPGLTEFSGVWAYNPKRDGSQVLNLQRDALLAAGIEPQRIYADLDSGRKDDRRTGIPL